MEGTRHGTEAVHQSCLNYRLTQRRYNVRFDAEERNTVSWVDVSETIQKSAV